MTDIYSPAKRSEVMAKVRGRDTAIERRLRSALHRLGFRFRLNVKTLPGSPDIVFPRYKKVVFVHGCFWHRHKGCKRAALPKTNIDFWRLKLRANEDRDRAVAKLLRDTGWGVLVVWQCQIENHLEQSLRRVRHFLTTATSAHS